MTFIVDANEHTARVPHVCDGELAPRKHSRNSCTSVSEPLLPRLQQKFFIQLSNGASKCSADITLDVLSPLRCLYVQQLTSKTCCFPASVAIVDSREEGEAIEGGLAADRGKIVDGHDVFLRDPAALKYADADVWRGKEGGGGGRRGKEVG